MIERQISTLGDDVDEVVIYTDGGCDPNPGPGGWATILWTASFELELAGGAADTTNNRMEMMAALQGLKTLGAPCRVTVVTDSQYLHNGMTDWITGWSKKGWRRGKKATLRNPDLWQALARVALEHETYWSWTRGHAGQPENERCDGLATLMTGRVHGSEDAITHQQRRERSAPLPQLERRPTAPIFLDDQTTLFCGDH